MQIVINASGLPISQELLKRIARASVPTFGHYVEDGAMDPGIVPIVQPAKFVGRAVTVKTVAPDSALVHKAVSYLTEGDVLVIQTDDLRHAPVGEVVGLAAKGQKGGSDRSRWSVLTAQELRRLQVCPCSRGALRVSRQRFLGSMVEASTLRLPAAGLVVGQNQATSWSATTAVCSSCPPRSPKTWSTWRSRTIMRRLRSGTKSAQGVSSGSCLEWMQCSRKGSGCDGVVMPRRLASIFPPALMLAPAQFSFLSSSLSRWRFSHASVSMST